MNANDLDREISRMEAGCGAELPEVPGPGLTLEDRVVRLMRSEDPPRGADLALLLKLMDEWGTPVEGLEFLRND